MSDDNSLTNIRNVLGFLLAGFGALLSFLGIRSSEVATVLRNNSFQASTIALILLLGVLTAISAIFTKSERKLCLPSAVAIGAILLGLGALVIFAIPVGLNPFTISGTISLVIGCLLVLAGTTALAHFRPFWFDPNMSRKYSYAAVANAALGKGRKLWPKPLQSCRRWTSSTA